MHISSLAAALALAVAPLAEATVIYNDFGASDAFDTNNGNTVSLFIDVGVRIVPAAATTATDISLAMMASGPVSVSLSVCADASGVPGAVLSSTSVIVTAGGPQVYHATFPTPASLSAGTVYWIKAGPAVSPGIGSATWMFNSTGQFGYSATLPPGAWVASNGPTPAVRLEDNAVLVGGACCAGATCAVTVPTACNALNTRFAGLGTTCDPAGNNTTPCCKADFNQSGAITVQDIFDFLNAWFAGSGQADINGGGLSVQDIFDFLTAWFAGC